MPLLLRIVLISSVLLNKASASSGDESFAFVSCMHSCTDCSKLSNTADVCSPFCTEENNATIYKLSLHRTVFRWTCVSDCQYRCMWAVESQSKDNESHRVQKYFGKWPFTRVLGMQEPASVLFSIMNLGMNAYCLARVVRWSTKPQKQKLSSQSRRGVLWATHFFLSCNAWIWSAVFHSRDTWVTERFDYFSAGILVSYDLFLTLALVFNIDSSTQALAGVGIPIAWFTLRHMYLMHTVLFDYGLHVKLCIAAGAVQTLAWLFWAVWLPKGRFHPGKRHLVTFIIAVNMSMALEIFDFPPIASVLDAHALWHAATAPLTLLWLLFVLEDIRQNEQQALERKAV